MIVCTVVDALFAGGGGADGCVTGIAETGGGAADGGLDPRATCAAGMPVRDGRIGAGTG